MKSFLWILLLALVFLSCVVFWAMRPDASSEVYVTIPVACISPRTPVLSGSPEAGGDDILVAVIEAATGDASEVNKVLFDGAAFAVRQLNEAGGVLGRKIRLLRFDNESTPLGSKSAAERAVQAKVCAVIGPARSSFAMAMGPILQTNGIPMITPSATNPKVTEIGDCIFRMCYTDAFQGLLAAQFARDSLKAKTAAVIVNANLIYCVDLASVFCKEFIHQGGRIVATPSYLDATTDYRSVLEAIQRGMPDVIFVPSEPRDTGFIIKQARMMGIHSQFLGSDSWTEQVWSFAGPVAEGSYFISFWHRDINNPLSKSFQARYEKEVGPISTAVIPLTCDAVMLLADAIRRAGSTDHAAIRSALAATTDFKGITGPIRFDADRNPVNKFGVILQLHNGKAIYKQVVDPRQLPMMEAK